MPSNFLIEYRDRLRAYESERHRAAYLRHSGLQPNAEFAAAEYSDLFTRAALDELQQEAEALPSYRETDRAALEVLRATASHQHLKNRLRELDNVIAREEADAMLVWEGTTLSFAEATTMLRNEPNPTRRHDLAARRAEIIKRTQDLRAERWAKLHEGAQDLGAENYLALYRQLRGLDYETLAAQLQTFLAQTEARYTAALSSVLMREAHVTRDEATNADLPYFRRLVRFAKVFPAWQSKHVYRETFSGLGIFTYKQDNLFLDDEPRPHKNTPSGHYPIRVPDEIRIVCTPQDGAPSYASLLHESGRAQQFAWTSRQLFPEFQYCGDGAVREAFGRLFGGLLHDARWLSEQLSYQESQEFRHLLAVQNLLLLRRFAAQIQYEVELHAGRLAATAATRYAELLTEAVRVRYDETEYLRDVADGFAVADTLRAAALEAQLREFLKTKFGSRWWTARKAGDFLIDLWNTGGRYQAEDLAKMIDLGALSFDWLAEDCLANL